MKALNVKSSYKMAKEFAVLSEIRFCPKYERNLLIMESQGVATEKNETEINDKRKLKQGNDIYDNIKNKIV